MRDNFDVLNNFITMWCRGVDERLKFNVRSSQGGCWNLADWHGFGKNIEIIEVDLVKTGKLRLQSIAKIEENLLFGLSKVLAWGKIEETDFAMRKWIMLISSSPQAPKTKPYPKILDIFGLTILLTNLQVKIQMCDWGQILGCLFEEKSGDVWGIWRWPASSWKQASSSVLSWKRGAEGVKVVMFGDSWGGTQVLRTILPKFIFGMKRWKWGWGGGFGLSEWRNHKTGVI